MSRDLDQSSVKFKQVDLGSPNTLTHFLSKVAKKKSSKKCGHSGKDSFLVNNSKWDISKKSLKSLKKSGFFREASNKCGMFNRVVEGLK